MEHPLAIDLTAPVGVDDVVAVVTLESGNTVKVVLRGGRLTRSFPSRPVAIQLTTEPPPSGEPALIVASPDVSGTPTGTPVDVMTLFERPYPVATDGRVALQLLWGCHCHSDRLPDAPEGRRFASAEHVVCADFVGLDRVDDLGSPRPLVVKNMSADFTKDTPLPVGNSELTFGQIVCLGGDFYAHLDAAAAKQYAWAWPPLKGFSAWLAGDDYRHTTLAGDGSSGVTGLLDVIERDKDVNHGAAGEFATLAFDTVANHYPARRYAALSSQNYCHFVCTTPGLTDDTNEALRLYCAYHRRALGEARQARNADDRVRALRSALVTDAFGCHFLTDLFASGHQRVPRRLLGELYGMLRGGLFMSLGMHNEDNVEGLWCTTRVPGQRREVWRAYGDGMLRRDIALPHLRRVQEAVRRSAAEVFAAHWGVETPLAEQAVAVVPVPLAPAEAPHADDVVVPAPGSDDTVVPNHWPLYGFARDGRVIHRVGRPWEASYEYVDDGQDVPEEAR